MSSERLRIVVLGYIIRGPYGGLAWHHLQYVLCLAALGHEVYFFEDSGDYPACCNPLTSDIDTNPAYGLEFAVSAFDAVGLSGRWAYFDAHTSFWRGPLSGAAHDLITSADILLNVSGVNPIRPWSHKVPVRVFIDTDPTFVQIRNLTDPASRELAALHTHFFTFAENIFSAACSIPNDGVPWRPTRQPIALDAWRVTRGDPRHAFTTVMQWDSYASRQHGGRCFGMKSASFPPFLDLPARTSAKLEMALGNASAPRDLLRQHGWSLCDSLAVTRTIHTYREYIAASAAEFSVAKHGYVATKTGWFSERSAAYLASGRPVVAQNTGFSHWLPTGLGLLGFSTPDEALAAIEAVRSRYAHHSRAAREIAAEYFDGRTVLANLIGDLNV